MTRGWQLDKIETLQDLLPRLATFDERPAVVALTKDGMQECTYATLTLQARRLASGLANASLRKGDHVALFAEGSEEWFTTWLGIVASGAVAVAIDTQLADAALSHVLRDSNAR